MQIIMAMLEGKMARLSYMLTYLIQLLQLLPVIQLIELGPKY